jgi:4-amino-4-deoxy-L-arabinose transferase-like glycosyltransferase
LPLVLVEAQNEVIVKEAGGQNRIAAALQSPALAVVAAFAVRMALLWWIHRDRDAHQFLFFPTSHEAWDVAWAMALGNGFSAPLTGMQGPTAWVAPAYPGLIALALKVTGRDSYGATILCLFLNCVISALTCWPIYGIGKKIAGREVGLASSWVWVFLPTALLFPLEWLWDPSFAAFFVALLIYWTLDFHEDAPLAAWAGYGALWAIAMLMNPAIGILFPFLTLWLVQQRRRSMLPWRPQAAVAALLLIAGLAPWTVRNYAAFGTWVPVKDNFGLEFWLGNNPSVKRNWSPDQHPVGNPHEMQLLLSLGETRYMQMKQRQAIEFIEAHPRIFLKSVWNRFLDTWTGLGDVPSDRWVSALRAGGAYIRFTSVLSLLALAGLFLTCRSLGWEAAPVWIAPIVFPITYYLTHSTLHYRHPIDPVLTVLSVVALAHALSWGLRRLLPRGISRAAQVN